KRKVTVPVGRSSRTRRDHPPAGSRRPVTRCLMGEDCFLPECDLPPGWVLASLRAARVTIRGRKLASYTRFVYSGSSLVCSRHVLAMQKVEGSSPFIRFAGPA